jgi:hypothetical protein
MMDGRWRHDSPSQKPRYQEKNREQHENAGSAILLPAPAGRPALHSHESTRH